MAVAAAILEGGLRIMPHSGGRVGRGIYLASESGKSVYYVQNAQVSMGPGGLRWVYCLATLGVLLATLGVLLGYAGCTAALRWVYCWLRCVYCWLGALRFLFLTTKPTKPNIQIVLFA